MSYEIAYDDIESSETIQKALDDCKQWLCNAQFKKVCKILKEDAGRSPEHLVRLGLAMQGIQGYPATAMMNRFWAK